MRILLVLFLAVVFCLGCARVRVEAPKDPIKVDISMRLDVYQHVQKDIDSIEDLVTGAKQPEQKTQAKDKQSFMRLLVTDAYAADSLSPEVQEAAMSRKGRFSDLATLESRGVVGENKMGLVEIRNSGAADASVQQLLSAENSNRMTIYRGIAEKNGSSVEEVQKLYAKRLQQDVPSGTPIEVVDEATGSASWQLK